MNRFDLVCPILLPSLSNDNFTVFEMPIVAPIAEYLVLPNFLLWGHDIKKDTLKEFIIEIRPEQQPSIKDKNWEYLRERITEKMEKIKETWK